MPLIFNSVTRFIETIGRRRTHVSRPDQLDSLECIFTGPTELATDFVPGDLARHPDFPGMQCSSWEITNKEALMAEARARYSGKFAAGAGLYVGVPLITTSRHLGSVSWTTSANTSSTTTVGGVIITAFELVLTSFAARFTLKSATFKYLTNRAPAPDFDGRFLSEATPYLGMDNFLQFTTARTYAPGIPPSALIRNLNQTLVFENDLTDLQVNDLGNGWFDVSEVYMTQALINSSLI
jgi:hypothetical protein